MTSRETKQDELIDQLLEGCDDSEETLYSCFPHRNK